MGAIAGGIVGDIGAISVAIATLFFCRRQRHPPTSHAVIAIDERPSGFNSLMDQVPLSMSGPGTVMSSVPDTDHSMLRFYVCVFVALALLVCAHVFVFCLCYDVQGPSDSTMYPNYQGHCPVFHRSCNPIMPARTE
jgi:hypothetical protein